MNCTECGGEVGANDNYCPHCGVVAPGLPADAPTEDPTEDLEASDAPRSGSVSLEDQIAALRSTIEDLQVELGQNSGRLLALEHMFNVPGVRPAGQQPHDPQPAPASAAAENQPTAMAGGDSVAPQTATTSQTRPAADSSGVGWFDIDPDTGIGWLDSGLRKVPTLDWEWLFGGNWLARIGIVALVVGVGFFLKLAFDNQWIGEIGRVSLGIAGGLALLGFGEFWRRRYPIWAQPVTAGGLAILYLAVYAASALYGLIPPLPALGFFFLVTLTAAALALRYEALTIAIIGILSGFATPLILADLLPDQLVLLAYVLVLDVGVLALATFRNWRWFTLLALVGSVALYIFWRDSFSPGILVAQSGLTAIFLIFVGATTLFHLLWRRMPGRLDQALIVLNGMAYFALSYYQLEAEYGVWMGAFAVLLALFYGLLGYGILARHREQVHHSLFAAGVALVFLTVAVPLQVDGPWVGVAWAVEAAVLIWISNLLGLQQFRWFALGAFVVLLFRVLLYDSVFVFLDGVPPFLNYYTITYAAAIVACYLAAYLMYRERTDEMPYWERGLFPAFLVAGNVVLTVAIPAESNGAWTAVAWAVEGLALIVLSLRLGLVELRLFGIGVFGVMAVRLLEFDTFDYDRMLFRPIINERFLGFAVGVVVLYASGIALWRWQDRFFDPREIYLIPALLIGANFLTLWILSAEAIASAHSAYFNIPPGIADNVASLSLSILWVVYAAILLIIGIRLGNRWVRVAGLALLGIPVVKLFLFDTFDLEQEYRVAAYLGLGAILVAGGFVYQRYSRAIRGFLLE